jgi:glycosyltransferase involved in cell wall biosynthesis
LKVAIVTSFPDDPGAPVGGVESVSVNLVEALTAFSDLEIHVVTTSQTRRTPEIAQWGQAQVHRLPWAGGGVLRNATGPGRRQMQAYLDRIEPDVIHAHDTYGLMVKGMPVPRVFTIHGFIHGDTLVSCTRFARLRSWLWWRIETRGWADQSHIISISPYVRERLGGIATGIIHDIDNPIAPSFFDIDRRERPGTVFCAAAITPRKNTLALVDAAAQVVAQGGDVEVRLAGSLGDTSYVQQVRQRIGDAGLQERVILLGGLTAEQIRAELSTAAVFALVSLEENSPMGIEEAMAAKVPVVTSNRCGMPYMVRDGESGFLVDPNRPADIAWWLGRLLEDDGLRRTMGAKGREIALDRFHPTTVASRTRQVYLRAVEECQRQ